MILRGDFLSSLRSFGKLHRGCIRLVLGMRRILNIRIIVGIVGIVISFSIPRRMRIVCI